MYSSEHANLNVFVSGQIRLGAIAIASLTMPDTKPFMSYPIWTNSKYGRQFWGRRQYYYKDVKTNFGWFAALWKGLMQNRSSMRILKFLIVAVLCITCAVNLKLALNAKVKYEQYKTMFSDYPGNQVTDISDAGDSNNPYMRDLNKIEIEVLSSKERVEVVVNGEMVLLDDSSSSGRGLHVVVLNEYSGAKTAYRLFDTYTEGEDENLQLFLESIKDKNRVLVFAIKDEASFHLERNVRQMLLGFGSKLVGNLQWRGMWAAVTTRNGDLVTEDMSHSEDTSSWGDAVQIKCTHNAVATSFSRDCKWPSTPENDRRESFCSQFDGYEELCSCDSTFDWHRKKTNFTPNFVYDLPVTVIASNRPQYLYRMLNSLLSADGVNPEKITVFIDGRFQEPMEITKLLGVKGIFHIPIGVKNARISQNYKASLSATFSINPEAEYAIILEEDLDVSPDLFSFFSQTLHLMEKDPSIYCISAWNDHGYHHSCQNSEKLYRVESFPGLGWLLSKKLFKEELEPNWPGPDKMWDWDLWMRQPSIRKNRECVIPDISRTFHFGSTGINMNSYFHHLYFDKRKINLDPGVKLTNIDSMTKDNYEKKMHLLVRDAVEVDHEASPCEAKFLDGDSIISSAYVAYVKVDKDTVLDEFKKLFKCLKLWDLDVRGLHKNSFQTYINNKHVIFVAYPLSPYSIYKPVEIEPMTL